MDPFGPLLLVVRIPEEEPPHFTSDLLSSCNRKLPSHSYPPGWLVTAELPTARTPSSAELPEADQIQLLSQLNLATHVLVPLATSSHSPALTLGRDPRSAIVLSDSSVSAQHAEFIAEDGGLRLRDEESKNGTFVNEQRLTRGQERWLQPMDQLLFGRITAFVCEPRTLRAVLRHDLRNVLELANEAASK